MDFHVDRKLRFQLPAEHKTLYKWAIAEVDDAGQQVGYDQIPWGWTEYFLATEVLVTDSLGYESRDAMGRDHAGMQINHRSSIRAHLKPGSIRNGRRQPGPTFRFFGTDRPIQDFQLDIIAATADQPEACTTWGSVSYTSETDFRQETQPDILQFYLMVPQTKYDRYAWNIAQGMCDVLGFWVGHVDGFYSEWSPSITTTSIKVLAGHEHVVEAGPDTLPRLGNVGKAELYMTAKRKMVTAPGEYDEPSEEAEHASDEGRQQGFRWPGRR